MNTERQIELAERIETLAKAVIQGIGNDTSGDMEINSADAYTAACLILDTARQQKAEAKAEEVAQ